MEGTVPDAVRDHDQRDDAAADPDIGNGQVVRQEAEAIGDMLDRRVAADITAGRIGGDQVTNLAVQLDVALDVPGPAMIAGRDGGGRGGSVRGVDQRGSLSGRVFPDRSDGLL